MFKISWPEELSAAVQSALGSSVETLPCARVAASVLKVSNLFIEGAKSQESKTPWTDKDLRQAYLSYFFPLNVLRVMRIVDEAKNRGFFDGIDHVVDIGSGPGTAELAFSLMSIRDGVKFQSFEPFREARQAHSLWKNSAEFMDKLKPFSASNKGLFILSYSLNELQEWPAALDSAEALMIIEPSTREHGRRLMELRQQLIGKGFTMWAPCTHQLACPLLTKTKTDWCHHRFPIDKPEWFIKLETHLPMKNDTLTVSYLLAKKVPPTFYVNIETAKVGGTFSRVIGDTLFEKGKVRQMICRGTEREFVSYLTRQGPINGEEWQGWPNGSLVSLPENLQTKGSELRLDKADLEKLVPSP